MYEFAVLCCSIPPELSSKDRDRIYNITFISVFIYTADSSDPPKGIAAVVLLFRQGTSEGLCSGLKACSLFSSSVYHEQSGFDPACLDRAQQGEQGCYTSVHL